MENICNMVQVGHEGITQTGERFVVIERIKKDAKIKFLDDYGAEIVRGSWWVKNGKVKNPYEITTLGVGRHGNAKDYNAKELSYWKRNICKKYAQGKLPHLNKRWLVLEYFLEDVRKIKDYELFSVRKFSLTDPFGRYDRIEHMKVSENNIDAKAIVVVDVLSNEYDLYSSRFEAEYETGWHNETILSYCKRQKEKDGYKYYFAEDYAELMGW